MKRLVYLFLIPFFALAFAQDMPVLYDSRLSNSKQPTAEPPILVQINRAAATAQKSACANKRIRDDDQGASSAKISGAFSRVKTKQSIYVVYGCRLEERSIAYLALYDQSQMMGLYQLDMPGGFVEVYGVNDVNLDGLRELALIYDWVDGCDGACAFRSLDVLEVKSGKLTSSTSLIVERGGDTAPEYRFSYTVYVLKGTRPVFVGVHNTATTTLTALQPSVSLLKITQIK